MRPATAAEIDRWDELVAALGTNTSVLQGQAFANIKARNGWQPRYYRHQVDKRDIPVLYLSRRVRGLGELWYAPGGPIVDTAAQLMQVINQVKVLPAFLVQFEPELPQEALPDTALEPYGIRRGRGAVQPNVHTVTVNLGGGEEALLDSFHSKTRYNIRLAARHGVESIPVELTSQNMAIMYRLMSSARDRGGYYLRPQAYFEQAWKIYAQQGSGQLFFASYQGRVLAGAFVTYLGSKALYKDGGSVREHREVQPMYGLQWAVMQWLQGQGVQTYDLHGTPPANQISNPHHPLAGLARFKTGFNPHITEYTGLLELPLDQVAYRRWRRVGERLYSSYLHRLRRQSLY